MVLKIKELKAMGKEDLNSKLSEVRKELIKLRTQVSRGTTLKNPGQIKQIKKTIARILTIQKMKEVGKKDE
tara:strand:+ start:316 stop:528 length:213 start_codon:yes stop_codon:yes gene_type:complete